MTPEEIGRRAFEVCVSDLAAKGGRPLWILASLGLPPSFRSDHLERIYAGMSEGLAEAGSGRIVGGNLTSTTSGAWFLDLTAIGAVAPGQAPLRDRARIGDSIFVSGVPGSAAAGLELLTAAAGREGLAAGAAREQPAAAVHPDGLGEPEAQLEPRMRLVARGEPWDRWVRAYCAPRARLALGSSLTASGLIHAALDTSDGLLGDLFHICEASGLAADLDLEALPTPLDGLGADTATVLDAVASLGIDPAGLPWRWILGPSDDYELLCTAPAAAAEELVALARSCGLPLREIGRLTAGGPAIRLHGAGHHGSPWTPQEGGGGFDHFARHPEVRR